MSMSTSPDWIQNLKHDERYLRASLLKLCYDEEHSDGQVKTFLLMGNIVKYDDSSRVEILAKIQAKSDLGAVIAATDHITANGIMANDCLTPNWRNSLRSVTNDHRYRTKEEREDVGMDADMLKGLMFNSSNYSMYLAPYEEENVVTITPFPASYVKPSTKR